MAPNDKRDFARLLTAVMSIYRQTVSEMVMDVWWNACQRYDLDQVSEAFNAHAMDPDTGQFPPKPADIVKHLQGTHGDRALVAWGKVFDAIQRVGSYQSVQFDDGVIHAVIEDQGGWVQLNRITSDELPFLQKRFCDAYRAYSRNPQNLAFSGHLPGLAEIHNNAEGLETPAPVLIGNPEQAARVALQAPGSRTRQITSGVKRLEAVVQQVREGGQA